ncbi:MAG TPA: hypothetical protein VMV51_06265 [Gemmatimonadaceae bacterium]|nr:hypothetical protein [Gemmatimonadaceae bacterium]
MLRAASALFGTIFLPVGLTFLFAFHHRHWMDGLGALAAALGFFFVAWRGPDLLGLDDRAPATERSLAEFIASAQAPPTAQPSDPPVDQQEHRP